MTIDIEKNSLTNRVAIVTGANTGIGRVTAMELARGGAHVFLACRSAAKAEPVVEEIREQTGNQNVEFLALDLGSLASVRQAAQTFLARDLPLHLLINNAGVAGQRGQTADGFELHFGVNHLGHFLLTDLLLERLESSAPARIVNVASKQHYRATGLDFESVLSPTASVTGLPEYANSKLANVLFTRSLAKRLEGTGVTVYALHPGVVASDAWRRIPRPIAAIMKSFMISNEDGAETSLYCALSQDAAAESGLYYDESKSTRPSHLALDDKKAEELWKRSEVWVQTAAES